MRGWRRRTPPTECDMRSVDEIGEWGVENKKGTWGQRVRSVVNQKSGKIEAAWIEIHQLIWFKWGNCY